MNDPKYDFIRTEDKENNYTVMMDDCIVVSSISSVKKTATNLYSTEEASSLV